jgi:2-iminoacetate synthase
MNKIMQNNVTDIKTILADKGLDGNFHLWQQELGKATRSNVEKVLSGPAGSYSFEKLLILLSPAAGNYLEEMAQIAHRLTIQRFGKTIRLYAPLYLSNYCVNSCLYCGFNSHHKYLRKRLTIDRLWKKPI